MFPPLTISSQVGYLFTETGSVPLMADETADLYKVVGRPIAGYEVRLPTGALGDRIACGPSLSYGCACACSLALNGRLPLPLPFLLFLHSPPSNPC